MKDLGDLEAYAAAGRKPGKRNRLSTGFNLQEIRRRLWLGDRDEIEKAYIGGTYYDRRKILGGLDPAVRRWLKKRARMHRARQTKARKYELRLQRRHMYKGTQFEEGISGIAKKMRRLGESKPILKGLTNRRKLPLEERLNGTPAQPAVV